MRDLLWYTDFTLWWHKREWNVPHVRGRWHRNKETSFQYTTAFANMSLSISNRFYLFVNLCYVYSGILQLLYICIWISLVLVNPVKRLVGYRRNIWRHWTSALYQGEHLLFDSNTQSSRWNPSPHRCLKILPTNDVQLMSLYLYWPLNEKI